MKRFFAIILLLLIVGIVIFLLNSLVKGKAQATNQKAQSHQVDLKYNSINDAYPLLLNNNWQTVHYTGFDLSYNETHEQANWVIYLLTRQKCSGTYKRKNNFRTDTNIVSGSATVEDYAGSGFDRGHLAPAADMKWSSVAMDESFLMSNISPQNASFNRGIWKKMEELVRSWTMEHDSIIVVTGPVFKDNLPAIGFNQVSIPEYYYKVLLNISYNNYKAIAFLIPQNATQNPLSSFTLSIDKLEAYTGINFFYKLNPEIMNPLEQKCEFFQW